MRNENLVLRVSSQEKQQVVTAAERAGVTATEYSRKAIVERAQIESIADRLLVAILTALDDHAKQIAGQLNSLRERTDVAATKNDLSKLAEWIANRTSNNGRTP